jgi:predicted NBD/HSP70 family sugar kinase
VKAAVADIGGTAIKYGIFENGSLQDIHEIPTLAAEGGPAVLNRVLDALSSLPAFETIGISTAGQVNEDTGSIIFANDNLPDYTGMQVRSIAEKRFGVPVAVMNDVNAAARGEALYGAGRGIRDFLMLTYGTGVGGAICADGKIYSGSSWSAGEFGGIAVHPEEMREGEVFSGCYENYASAAALIRKMKAVRPDLTDGRKIFAELDDPAVRQCIDAWIFEVVIGLTTLIHIFNPSAVLLGGGIMAQEYVIHAIQTTVRFYLAGGFQNTAILGAALGNHAGMIGAAAQAIGYCSTIRTDITGRQK